MGGVTAELFKDTTMRLLPEQGGLSHDDALGMMRQLKTWPLLDGYRGRPKADIQALANAIVAFSEMVAQMGERLIEAELNPLFVLSEGQGVQAPDGIAILARSEERRVGTVCVRTGRYRWSPYHQHKNIDKYSR